jgi:hypothetical protein
MTRILLVVLGQLLRWLGGLSASTGRHLIDAAAWCEQTAERLRHTTAPIGDYRMARPKGSKNKPKVVPTSDGAATPEHNAAPVTQADLSEDQRQALFFRHRRDYKAVLAKKKETDAAFKQACKLIKSEGTELEDIKLSIQLEAEEGDAKLKARMEAQLRIARYMGSSVGTQFDMFAEPDRTPSVDRAYADGKRDGLAGETARAIYANPSEQYERYMAGWHAGQAVCAAGIKQLDPAPDAPQEPDEEFDDATSSNPSRRRQADPLAGGDAAGSYQVQ